MPGRERPGHNRDDCDAQQDQRGPVVHEALALDDVDQPSRHPEPPSDRSRRDRVGRGDDRAEDEGLGPGKVGNCVRDHCNADRCHGYEPEREQGDRPQVLPQLPEPGEVRRDVEKRRQDADQHDLGRHRHRRHARREAEQKAPENEQDRVRDPQRPRENQQRCGRGEQRKQLQLLP